MQPETETTPVEEVEEEIASPVEEEEVVEEPTEETVEEPVEESTEEIVEESAEETVEEPVEETEDAPEESESEESESEEEEEEEQEEDETTDREFDKNPTILYALVQKKLWKEAIARAKSDPTEAEAFIVRKEKDGSIRWRLLPIHAAIVFKAPESVIEALLTAYPMGAQQKDDQEMLPLHLAFRNGASEEIVNLLLCAFPESIDSPDRKGRVPLTLAKNSDSAHSEAYIAALEKGVSHYYVTALALARERILAEQKEIYDAKLEDALKLHQVAFSELGSKSAEKQKEIEATVAEKDAEIEKLLKSSESLSGHIESLEGQIACRTDTERLLCTKIAKLEQKVREDAAHLEEREAAYIHASAEAETALDRVKDEFAVKEGEFEIQKAKLDALIEGLELKVERGKVELANAEASLKETVENMQDKEERWNMLETQADGKFAKVEIDWANAKANVTILENQLKKRMENEQILASQVATLAAQLAESADKNIDYVAQIKKFETEKADLEATVHLLKLRLAGVVGTMQSTRDQQIKILDDAIAQEEGMVKVMESHAEIVKESIAQEQAIEAAKAEMIALVEKTFENAQENRLKFMSLSGSHGASLSGMNANRSSVLSCAQTVSNNVIKALDKELNLDTLDSEVEMLVAQRGPSESALSKVNLEVSVESFEAMNHADEAAPVEEAPVEAPVEEEVREDVEEVVVEETPAATPEVETTTEETAEVVVASPKHVEVATETPAEEESVEEETRTEEAVDTRVTAE